MKFSFAIQVLFFVLTALLVYSCCITYKTKSQTDFSAMKKLNGDSIAIANAIENLDTANIPEFIIYINMHFVNHRKIGNFYRGELTKEDPANGMYWAEKFIGNLNYQLDHLAPSKTSLENFTGNARYNVQLFTESSNVSDTFDGIWFWESTYPRLHNYSDSVLHLIFLNDEQRKLNGSACGMNMCNTMNFYGAYDNAANKGNFGWWSFASLFNHEFGHIMGLCHSFYCDNPCNGIDLDVTKECLTNPCFNDCGGPNGKACNNWDSGSTNMMGYNPDQNSLTPCQWKHIMHTLQNTKAKYVKRIEKNTLKLE